LIADIFVIPLRHAAVDNEQATWQDTIPTHAKDLNKKIKIKSAHAQHQLAPREYNESI